MNKTQSSSFAALRGAVLLGLASWGMTASASDLSWKNIQFGGFVSQGYLLSSANDYLGETSDGTADFREYAVNASWSKGKLRIGAQAFGQELGDYGNDQIKLDWAVVDYQAAQWLGIRAGRVKMPRGLYNEALDLDSVRPFVLLPQSVYDARLRDFNAAFNGAMIYGNVAVGRFGSLDYRAFYGDIPMSVKSGATEYFNTGMKAITHTMGMDYVRGGTFFWSTPISGLRTGYSFSQFGKLKSERTLVSGTTVTPYTKEAEKYDRHLVSAEYVVGDWTFAAEAGRETGRFIVLGTLIRDAKIQYAYVSAARRVNRWLELGTYFSYSQDKQASNALLRQADYALSARFDINEHLLFKLEYHQMNGAGKIFDTQTRPQPLALRDNNWNMVAAKVTFTF